MVEKLERLLVTKLSLKIHEKLKEIAKGERRTLSGLNRIIIEDYIKLFERKLSTSKENNKGGI